MQSFLLKIIKKILECSATIFCEMCAKVSVKNLNIFRNIFLNYFSFRTKVFFLSKSSILVLSFLKNINIYTCKKNFHKMGGGFKARLRFFFVCALLDNIQNTDISAKYLSASKCNAQLESNRFFYVFPKRGGNPRHAYSSKPTEITNKTIIFTFPRLLRSTLESFLPYLCCSAWSNCLVCKLCDFPVF